MKKVVSFIVCFLMIFTSTFMPALAVWEDVDIDVGIIDDTKEAEILVTDMSGKYKTQGRTTISGGYLMIDHSASSFEFDANCMGDVYVTFNPTYISSYDTNEKGCYFTVEVDGVKKSRDFLRLTKTEETKVKIAENLLAGKHSFKIYRQTEMERATVGIKSVTLKGSLLNAPENKKYYIEFVGDSITTAYGNLGYSGCTNPALPFWQDATQGYAFLTAEALNVDYSLVAQQGIGAYVGWQPHNMYEYYTRQRYSKDTTTLYNFERKADVVVIALGANDMSRYADSGKTLADVKNGFSDMFDLVKSKNPDAKIVWIYGMMPSSANAGETIKQVIAEKGGEAGGYYTLQMQPNTSGGNGHPSAAAHKTFAETLTNFLKSKIFTTFTPGDVDNTGSVNLNDVTRLAQYVAKWDVAVVVAALDPDGSGSVNLNDVTRLAQKVARWDVTLSDKPYVPKN